MRKLTHSQDSNHLENRRISKLVPVLAGAVALGLTLGVPLKSDAEQPRQRCTASVERGNMPSYTSTSRTGRSFRTPLLETGRYMEVAMPNAYIGQVSQAAAERPEPERQTFIADLMQRNVSAALTALGSSQRATFTCVSPTATPPAAPVTAAPQPTAPAPTSVPPTPQPAPSDGGTVQPAPVPDGGTGEPAQRRRVIQPGQPSAPGSKAAPAPKQNESATATQAPIPPVRKGGKGTESEPYVIEVPVPSKRAAGSELYREKFSYTFSGPDVSQKIYLSLRFVAASGNTITSKSQLIGQIAPIASVLMSEALRARGVNETPGSGSLVKSIGSVVGNAKKENADVRTYASE